jgi:hypothetical protein
MQTESFVMQVSSQVVEDLASQKFLAVEWLSHSSLPQNMVRFFSPKTIRHLAQVNRLNLCRGIQMQLSSCMIIFMALELDAWRLCGQLSEEESYNN